MCIFTEIIFACCLIFAWHLLNILSGPGETQPREKDWCKCKHWVNWMYLFIDEWSASLKNEHRNITKHPWNLFLFQTCSDGKHDYVY